MLAPKRPSSAARRPVRGFAAGCRIGHLAVLVRAVIRGVLLVGRQAGVVAGGRGDPADALGAGRRLVVGQRLGVRQGRAIPGGRGDLAALERGRAVLGGDGLRRLADEDLRGVVVSRPHVVAEVLVGDRRSGDGERSEGQHDEHAQEGNVHRVEVETVSHGKPPLR